MHVLSSLTQREILECQQTFSHDDPVSALNELVRICFQCEEHRNAVLHSFWPGKELRADEGVRVKFTAKARRGLHKTEQLMTSGQLLDIADYMAYASTCIEEFYGFPFCGADDLMNGGGEHNLP